MTSAHLRAGGPSLRGRGDQAAEDPGLLLVFLRPLPPCGGKRSSACRPRRFHGLGGLSAGCQHVAAGVGHGVRHVSVPPLFHPDCGRGARVSPGRRHVPAPRSCPSKPCSPTVAATSLRAGLLQPPRVAAGARHRCDRPPHRCQWACRARRSPRPLPSRASCAASPLPFRGESPRRPCTTGPCSTAGAVPPPGHRCLVGAVAPLGLPVPLPAAGEAALAHDFLLASALPRIAPGKDRPTQPGRPRGAVQPGCSPRGTAGKGVGKVPVDVKERSR